MMQYEVHQFNFVETPRKTYHGKILIRKLGCSSYILSTILIFFEYMKSFDGEKTKKIRCICLNIIFSNISKLTINM